MKRSGHSVAAVVLTVALGAGLGGTRMPSPPPAFSPFGQGAQQAAQHAASDSVCRWSMRSMGVLSAGAGEGQELIVPVPGAAAAVVNDLAGFAPAFSLDGYTIGTVDGNQVRIWRADDGQQEYALPGDSFVLSPDGGRLAIHGADGWYLWDAATRQRGIRLADPAARIYFSGSGQTVVAVLSNAANSAATVQLFDAKTGAQRLALENIVTPTAISPDGAVFAAARWQGIQPADLQAIVLWDTATGKELHSLAAEVHSHVPLAGGRGHPQVDNMTFSPDGRMLLSTGKDAIRLWNVATGEHVRCFQTPNHAGARTAAWGADAQTIVAPVDGDIYLWNTDASHPIGLLGPAGDSPDDAASIAAAAAGKWISWPLAGGQGSDGHKAYIWDLGAQRLLTVLPVSGFLSAAAISPAGPRAVTVSAGQDTGLGTRQDTGADIGTDGGPDGARVNEETLLWDTNKAAGLDLAAAQQSYWQALVAAADGKPPQEQRRLLRKAQSLSPELFGRGKVITPDEIAGYAAFRSRQEQVAALAGGAEPQTRDFYAEVRSVRPEWTTWPRAELVEELVYQIARWSPGDAADLVAVWQEFAAADPAAAQDGTLLDALLQVLAPQAAALARQGDIERAASQLQAALAPYPGLTVAPRTAAKAVYAHALVQAGQKLAQEQGDVEGAIAQFQAALKLDPSLALDPRAEANQGYVQWLLATGQSSAAAGDIAGAVAKYKQAVALDPSLGIDPAVEANTTYAEALVAAADDLAAAGDVRGAAAKYMQALALDPSLDIDPKTQAAAMYTQGLVDKGYAAAHAGDYSGAVTSFAAAARRDPSLLDWPPDYVQTLCALGAAVIGQANAAAICEASGVEVVPLALGASVTGTLDMYELGFRSFDISKPMTVMLDLAGSSSDATFSLTLYGPGGAIIAQSDETADSAVHLTAALPSPGRYLVAIANTGGGVGNGDYRLMVSAAGN